MYEKLTLTKSLKADHYILLRNSNSKLDFHLPLQFIFLKDWDDEAEVYALYIFKEKRDDLVLLQD